MTVMAGARLGPYEILAPLGAGGMGEVYRARDTRLGREVAIKVLPEELSADRERLDRFEEEARSASALNHPNIVTIHDIGRDNSTSYIAMELVEGKTLRDLLAAGALPLRKLLAIAAQVADGLSKAHGAGIVHRDLKPENLMVSKEGLVKVLDFGLAKLIAASSGELSKMPTMARPETQPGTVLGTVGYMSPEQASGQPLDFRSDQFSLGSILYEMATGKRAFTGATAVDTLSAILHEEPEAIGAINPKIPLPLRWTIERCLAKDPEERYASTRDLARDLAALRDRISEVSGAIEGLAPAPARARRRLRPLLWGLAALGGLAVGIFAGRPLRKTEVPSFQQLTFRRGYIQSARFAPDGQTIVYGAQWDGNPVELFSARPGGAESRALGLPRADVLAISSSEQMAIKLERRPAEEWISIGTLARMPLAGGEPREILEDVQEADWAPDGASLAIVRQVGRQQRLEFPVGKVLYETVNWISHPRVSPKGDLVAFLDHPVYGDDRGSVLLVDRDGKKRTLSDGWASEQGLAWSATGKEVWFTASKEGMSSGLYAVTPSGRQRVVARVPGRLRLHDIWRDGRVLLTRDNMRHGNSCLPPGGTKERDLSWLDYSLASDISADGKTLLLTEFGEGGGPRYAVYLRKTDGSPAVRLGEGLGTALSPDGKWALSILYTAPPQLILLPTGPGDARALEAGGVENYEWATWLPDGKRILFAGSEPGRGVRIYVHDLAGGKPRAITPEGVGFLRSRPVSPDGKFVVARGPDQTVSLYPVEGGADSPARPLPGLLPGDFPSRWTADGRALYVYRRGELPSRVYRFDLSSQRRELWKEILPDDPAGVVVGVYSFLPTPDGKSYVYSYPRYFSDLYLVEGLK